MTHSPLFIRRALISVSDKSKILTLAQSLVKKNVQILSTQETAKTLSQYNIPTLKISDYLQLPNIMNGKIKTLHYKLYAEILSTPDINKLIMRQYNIQPINMIVINFYPFHSVKTNKNLSHGKILEYIDIGGPSMVRAAIKNYCNVIVITDNNDYAKIINEMNNLNGSISFETRLSLAIKALKYIIQYDQSIHEYLTKISKNPFKENKITVHEKQFQHCFPNTLNITDFTFNKKQKISYGENPHQKAALYIEKKFKKSTGFVATAQQIQGKPLSYNNIADMDTALECVKMFTEPTCVIVKHENPCGVATSNNILNAYNKAYQADPISAFGGIIAFNRSIDKKTAISIINQQFVEAIIAPNIHQDCINIFSQKKHIRILICGNWSNLSPQHTLSTINFKSIQGGLLVQDYDTINLQKLEIITIRKPTHEEMQNSLFCWKIVKFVKSNAIVCGKNYQTTGIGSGQTNRVYAVRIATTTAQQKPNINITGSVMASDAFFTFPDGINIAAKMGIRCIIQPGGSIKDQTIIETANKHNIAMIFTHIRHFRH